MTRKIASQRRAADLGGQTIARNVLSHFTKLRAREPISRSFGLVRGKFPSRKIGRMIHWESQLERDAVYLFEFSPGVTSFREQPLTTYYTLNGKTRRYTPDFELVLSTGELILIEVKPAVKLLPPSETERFGRIHTHFESKGFAFRILTDTEIQQPILLDNLRVMMRHRHKPFSAFEKRSWAERFIGRTCISFADATASLGNACTVWQLIDEGILSCDLSSPVNDQTILHIGGKGESNEKLFF